MKLKICGMKYDSNIKEVINLKPNYIGFIFWKNSQRYVTNTPSIPNQIIKTGVFVDSSIDNIISIVESHNLSAIQLHGNETPELCLNLKKNLNVEIIKAFNVDNYFEFNKTKLYLDYCDYFLFDSKGELPGGNGFSFKWEILRNYNYKKPFFISGGISLDNIYDINFLKEYKLPVHCVDVNSKFESEIGYKKIDDLKKLIKILNNEL